MPYNSGVIMLIISNHPRALCSSDLKSRAGESLNCTPLSPIYAMTSNNNNYYYNNSNSNNGNNNYCNDINNQILILKWLQLFRGCIRPFCALKLPEEAKKIEIFRKFQRWMEKTNIFSASHWKCILLPETECHIINNLLTKLAQAVLGNIGPRSWQYGPRFAR